MPIVLATIVLLVGVGGGVFLIGQEGDPPGQEPGKDLSESLEPPPAPEPKPAPAPAPSSADPSRMWLVEPAFAPGRRGRLGLPMSTTATLPSDRNKAVEVGVQDDGTLWIAGKEVGLERLKEELFIHSELARNDEHPSQPSNTPALITADERVRWRVIQYVMQTCADPAVRIWNIHLAVRTADGESTVDIPLPNDLGLAVSERRQFKIELKRARGDPHTRVELDGVPMDPEDFGYLGELLAVKFENFPDATAELHAWAWVPLRHVVDALDRIRGAGLREITFIGAPPPEQDTAKDAPALGE